MPDSIDTKKVWTYYARCPEPYRDNIDNRFCFRFYNAHGRWRARILRTPDYGTRDDDCMSAHYYTDEDFHTRYICVQGGSPVSLEKMVQLAMVWSDRTLRYIMTGQAINDP